MKRQRYCLALDLKNDPEVISEYKKRHEAIWPEILESIKDAGIEAMDIYCVANRLFVSSLHTRVPLARSIACSCPSAPNV